jgi:hypothetical protein
MAYDEELADRIRALVSGEPGLAEKKMFGGLAFLVGGNMAIAASGQGGLLVRVDPADSDALVSDTPSRLFEMRGRKMPGWLRVDALGQPTRRARYIRYSSTLSGFGVVRGRFGCSPLTGW